MSYIIILGYLELFLTDAASSVDVAISYESVFALAPIALYFWHNYEIRPLITCAGIGRAFHDCLIHFSFTESTCRVRSDIIYNHWKCPRDLDGNEAIVKIRRFGMEKSGIIVGAVAFSICWVDGIVAVVCRVDSITNVEIRDRRE